MADYVKLLETLRYCSEHDNCGSGCPRFEENDGCLWRLTKDAADAIEELLAAVPKQGEWLPHPNPQFIETDVCSVCGLGTRKMHHCTDGVQTWDEKTFFRYCPWCGAKLKEPPKGVE